MTSGDSQCRRLLACRDILEWETIPARTAELDRIVLGEFAENEVRKDFTPSERVAILEALETNTHGGDRRSDQEQNIAVDRDDAAKAAGFGNRETARQAKKVVESGGTMPRRFQRNQATPICLRARERRTEHFDNRVDILNLPVGFFIARWARHERRLRCMEENSVLDSIIGRSLNECAEGL